MAKAFVKSKKFIEKEIKKTVYILVPQVGKLYHLNESGTLVWQSLTKKPSLADIIQNLEEEYRVDKKKTKKEVTKFLNDLKKKNLVKEVLVKGRGKQAKFSFSKKKYPQKLKDYQAPSFSEEKLESLIVY